LTVNKGDNKMDFETAKFVGIIIGVVMIAPNIMDVIREYVRIKEKYD